MSSKSRTPLRTHPSTPPPARSGRPGFFLYVSLPDEPGETGAAGATTSAAAARASAARLVDAADVLRELALDLLPDAETVTELALVPTAQR